MLDFPRFVLSEIGKGIFIVEDARKLTQPQVKVAQTTAKRSLKKKARLGEETIRIILLMCGVISIFTTIGIIVTLGSQARLLFTQLSLLNSNNRIVESLSPDDTTIHLTEGGFTFRVDGLIEIGPEVMRVLDMPDRNTLVVERGIEGSEAIAHNEDATVYIAERVTIREFLTNTRWQPQIAEFGIWPLLNATLIISTIAMLVALPIGLGTAIYISEYASPQIRSILKPILEILAGVPTVVYGYFALTFMTPLLRTLLGQDTVEIFNMASAGIVMGIMIIPTISSISEDALHAVPDNLRQASYGLGATKYETTTNVLIPAALSGIVASFLLGFSRAVGETMIVAIAAGAGPNLTFNPFKAAETITGHIVRISTGDLSYQSVDYNSLFALGLTLFIITLILNIVSGAVTRRFREVYQ